MNQAKPKIRLYVSADYTKGQRISLGEKQSHYLSNVMRVREGDVIAVFNGKDGEWQAEIERIDKKNVTLYLKEYRAEQIYSPDLWLAFAPIKSKTELVVEKATELGVAKIITVIMKYSVVDRVNMEKLMAHAIEAAEQCERRDVPELEECKNLSALLGAWPKDRTLLYGDESGEGAPLKTLLSGLSQGKYGVLVGPEGGFSVDEHRMLKAAPFVKAFGMGPRILRADTAATAALACVQSWLGDWEQKPRFEVAS